MTNSREEEFRVFKEKIDAQLNKLNHQVQNACETEIAMIRQSMKSAQNLDDFQAKIKEVITKIKVEVKVTGGKTERMQDKVEAEKMSGKGMWRNTDMKNIYAGFWNDKKKVFDTFGESQSKLQKTINKQPLKEALESMLNELNEAKATPEVFKKR